MGTKSPFKGKSARAEYVRGDVKGVGAYHIRPIMQNTYVRDIQYAPTIKPVIIIETFPLKHPPFTYFPFGNFLQRGI